MITGVLYIQNCGSRVNLGVADNHHDVRIGGEGINERSESTIANFHALELRLCLPTTQLELLDNVGNLFKAVCIKVRRALKGMGRVVPGSLRMGNDQKCGAFKQDDFVCIARGTKLIEMRF